MYINSGYLHNSLLDFKDKPTPWWWEAAAPTV